jgi:hypothetical protein
VTARALAANVGGSEEFDVVEFQVLEQEELKLVSEQLTVGPLKHLSDFSMIFSLEIEKRNPLAIEGAQKRKEPGTLATQKPELAILVHIWSQTSPQEDDYIILAINVVSVYHALSR